MKITYLPKNLLRLFTKGKNSFFFRMALLNTIFMALVLTASTILLSNYMNSNMEREIHRSYNLLLKQVQIFTDTYLLDKVNSLITEKYLDMNQDNLFYDFFYYNRLNNNEELLKLKSLLTNSSNLKDNFIDSVYFYRNSDDTVASSKEGVMFKIFTHGNINQQLINTPLIKSTMSSAVGQRWISPGENNNYWADRRIISYTQAIPISSSIENRKGCIIINIDQDLFFKSLNRFSDNNGELMVIDNAGNLFYHSDAEKLRKPFNIAALSNSITKMDEGFETININGTHSVIIWVKSSLNNWKFVSIVPLEILNRDLFIARQVALGILAVILLIGLTGINLLSSRIFKPFRALVLKSRNTFTGEQSETSDLNILNQTITHLSYKVDEMGKTLDSNRDLIKYKLVLDILHGNLKSEEEIKNIFGMVNEDFDEVYFSVLFTEIEEEVFNQLSLEQRQYISYKSIDLINEYFSSFCRCVSICNPANTIITIINHNPSINITASLDSLMDYLKNEINVRCNMSVAEPTTDFLELSKYYTKTVGFLKYRFIFGLSNIFNWKLIERLETSHDHIELESFGQFEALLKSQKFDSLKEEFTKIIVEIKNGNYSYTQTQNILLQMINLICRTSKEQNIVTEKLDKHKIFDEFNTIISLDKCLDWIFCLLDIYRDMVSDRNYSMNSEYITKIISYINSHLDCQISLNIVADEFNITPNYLSKIFKDAVGVNFSDFLIVGKLEKAAEMLITEKKLKIADIAEKLGYLNLPYFAKLFKEKYGMTPVQYRKSKTGESLE